MIVSEAKLAANRANAQKSTGPKSFEGKAICRANAVDHGLSGAGVALPEAMRVSVEEIVADWCRDYPPRSAYETHLVREMALGMVRMEEADARLLSYEHARRHELARSWDEIRGDAAAALGEKLAKKPERTVLQLRTSSHGCEWLKARWECLREGLQNPCDWTDAEVERFFDLQGIALDVRARDCEVLRLRQQIDQAKLGNQEAVDELREGIETLIDYFTKRAAELRETTEAVRRGLIESGGWIETTTEARNLRKLFRAAERLFESTWAKLQNLRAGRLGMVAPDVEKTEDPSPQLLRIAPKAPPPPQPQPSSDPSLPKEHLGLTELSHLLDIPFPTDGGTRHERATWEYEVVKQAVAMHLVGPERLEAFRGLDAILARGEL